MTETLLLKLEEKMMTLVAELEEVRRVNQQLTQENAVLKVEKESYSKKIGDILSLLDAVAEPEFTHASTIHGKPMLVQSL